MVNKLQERLFAETAIRLLDVDWRLVEIPEPLDFEVECSSGSFGLEVRQIFADGETSIGSPAKAKESRNQALIRILADRYYQMGGLPISVKFVGLLSADNTEENLKLLLDTVPLSEWSVTHLDIKNVKIFITYLPTSCVNYSRWVLENDRGGWARTVTTADLQNAIDKKAHKLPLYKQKYRDIDLLLVADCIFKSGILLPSKNLSLGNPGFRHIYFLSYPQAIDLVC